MVPKARTSGPGLACERDTLTGVSQLGSNNAATIHSAELLHAFGANIVGAVAGGLAQNLSFIIGTKVLLIFASVSYASALFLAYARVANKFWPRIKPLLEQLDGSGNLPTRNPP
jgi:hypothetical protein